jgi:Xaa-Pro aminopeptidase
MIKIIKHLQQKLKRRKIEAILITQPDNRRYLSGYTVQDHSILESAGVLLIPARGTPFLFTDSRFSLEAEKEARGFEIQIYQGPMLNLLSKTLKLLNIQRLAFESHYLLYSSFLNLKQTADRLNCELVPVKDLIEEMRKIKSDLEIEKIQKSVLLNEKVFEAIYPDICPGITEKELAAKIENQMRIMGASGPSFETIIASGPNGALPHARPSGRKLQNREPIVIDMGLVLDGYCSDMTRTIVLGQPDEHTRKIFRLVRKAQLAGIKKVKPGLAAQKIDMAARKIIQDAGYGKFFGHGLGHGVGLAVHEAPSINKRNRKKLQEGMIITIEPGIYIPDWGGIRLENMFVVKNNSCLSLNKNTTFLDI